MKESVISVFTNWNNFKGRACRSEFWYFVLASALLGLVVGIIEVTTGMIDIEKGGSGILGNILNLLLLVPSLSATSRCLHDYGYTGWHQLSYLSIIGNFVVLI
jgi:uncharacterized membrane protein YhaH (DUF805 family)